VAREGGGRGGALEHEGEMEDRFGSHGGEGLTGTWLLMAACASRGELAVGAWTVGHRR
jgi:hypothetical protein